MRLKPTPACAALLVLSCLLMSQQLQAQTALSPTQDVGSSVVFIRTDAATQGNWKGKYGVDGYNVIRDAVAYPSYAQVTTASSGAGAWVTSTTDVRALQKIASVTDRVAGLWYWSTSFTVDLNLVD